MPSTLFIQVLSLLFLTAFGLAYNLYIAHLEKKGVEGETWLWVVIGVGVTVCASGFVIGWINVLWLLALFAASGLPMMIGARNRYQKKLKRLAKRQAE